MRWFLPFTFWYVLWLALIANSAWEIASGDLAFGVPSLCVVLLPLSWTLWRNWRWNRSAECAARAAVEQVLGDRARSGQSTWLHRNGHVRLTAVRRGHLFWASWILGRADEDQLGEIHVHGRAPVTMEAYMFAPVFPRVAHFIEGAMMTAAGEVDRMPAAEPGLMWMVRLTGLTGRGKDAHAFADTAELADLAAQLRAAVPV